MNINSMHETISIVYKHEIKTAYHTVNFIFFDLYLNLANLSS